jgi:two-component system copper resistance phosphate regulon response regulator CusR
VATVMQFPGLTVDWRRFTVTSDGREAQLSRYEAEILRMLVDHRGEVVTRTELTEHVWNDTFDAVSNVVDVTVYRLRKKIDGDRPDRLIHTVKGVGYVLYGRRR